MQQIKTDSMTNTHRWVLCSNHGYQTQLSLCMKN